MHMMRSMLMNTCMGTINGTSVDRFIVDDADILELTCTENMEWIHEHACSVQWIHANNGESIHANVYYNF